jgi:hypothetical protein
MVLGALLVREGVVTEGVGVGLPTEDMSSAAPPVREAFNPSD